MRSLFGKKTTPVLLSALGVALVLAVIKIDLGGGFVAGLVFSAINLYRMESFTDDLLHYRSYNKFVGYLFFVSGNFILIVPFVLAYFFPQWINVFTVAFGALYFKLVLFSSVLTKGAA
jgi:hypothetical protein